MSFHEIVPIKSLRCMQDIISLRHFTFIIACLASMNASFVCHSSSTLKSQCFVLKEGVESPGICYVMGMMCWIVSCQPTHPLNNLSASNLKALMALSNSLCSEHKMRCMLLMDYKREDAFNFALKQVKAVLLSSKCDDLLRLTLELTRHMQRDGTTAQKVQLNRVEAMLRSRGSAFYTQIQEQLAGAVQRLPLILATQGSTLMVNTEDARLILILSQVHEGHPVEGTGCVELRELLRSAVRTIAQQEGGETTIAGVAGEKVPISDLSEIIAGLLFDAPMEGCELVERVVAVCEESWLGTPPTSISSPPTLQSTIQATLHLNLITCLLEKQISAGVPLLRARCLWRKVLQYASFAFTKLVLCGAQEESKRHFSFLKSHEDLADKTENENDESSSALHVFQACKDAIARLHVIFRSGTSTAHIVSCCVAKILRSQPFLQERSRDACAPRLVIHSSLRAVCADAAFCPLNSFLGAGICALLHTDTLYPQLLLAMCVSNALHEDLTSLGSLSTTRVGLSSFPASLGVVDALRPWAVADVSAAMGLVMQAVSHRFNQVATRRSKSTERDVMKDGREEGGDERPLLLAITRLTRFLRDVAVLFQVSDIELLDLFATARLNGHGNYQDNAENQAGPSCGVEGLAEDWAEGINLTQRATYNPLSILHTAVFLMCLCESGEDENIAQLQQSLMTIFAKDPAGALLLVNDITFLGPMLSVYSDVVVSERISSCINSLLRAKSAGSQDNSYIIELLKIYLAALPNFLTVTRNGTSWPKNPEDRASGGPGTSPSAPDFAKIDRLECEVLDKFHEQSQSTAITDLLCVSGSSSPTRSSAASVMDRVHVLNRLATLGGTNALAASAARAYLPRRSELFDALVSGGSAQRDCCRLIFSPLEQELCQRPSTSEPVYMDLVSSAKLEFLLSHHCGVQTDIDEASLPWANWNDLTFCFVHALRSTVRVVGDRSAHTCVADAQCVALLDAYSSFISLPALTAVLRWSLLALLEPSCKGEGLSATNREETDEVVLQKYICAVLALLESPRILFEQAAQTLCGAFNDLVVKKLWRRFVSDTELFKSTFLPILDCAVALVVSKMRDEETAKVLALSTPLFFLSVTVARQFVETGGPSSPTTALCRRLCVNCSTLLRSVVRVPREHKFLAPLSLVSTTTSELEYFVSAGSTRYRLSHQISAGVSYAEASVMVEKLPDTIADASVHGVVAFSSLMSSLLDYCTKPEGGARAQASSRGETSNDGQTPPVTDAEFDALVSAAVWGPALRGSSDAWAPADFTFVRLLEEMCEKEFRGDGGRFVPAAMKVLLSYDCGWLKPCSSTETESTWSSRRARTLVVLLQFMRNKSSRAAAATIFEGAWGSSVLSLVAASFQASKELASTVHYAPDKDVARHRRNVLLRRALRWKLSLLRFVDFSFVTRTLRSDMLKEKGAVSELGSVVALCRWCAKWKEPVPTHARNLFTVVLGSVVSALLSREEKEDMQSLQGQVRAAVGAVLSHLLQIFAPGPCGFLVHCQGILLKYSVQRSAEVCGVFKEIIDSDEHLAGLHAQVTAHNMVAHQHSTPSALAAPSTTNTPSTKRPATAMSPCGSATSSAQGSASCTATDANKKPRRTRPIGESATDGAVATPQPQHAEGRHCTDNKLEPHQIPSSLHTPDTYTDNGVVEPGSGTRGRHAQPSSRLRANNSFLSAIMEVPTVASPEASTPKTEPPSVPQASAPFSLAQHSTSANFDFAPGSAAKSAKSTPSKTEPNSRPAAAPHVSKKFGGGF